MKKIIALRVMIAFFITYNLVAIAFSIYMLSQLIYHRLNDVMYYTMLYTSSFLLVNELTLLPGLIIIYQALQYFIRRGYFNAKSASKFKTSGILLMISSVTGYLLPNLFRYKYALGSKLPVNPFLKWFDSIPLLFVVLLIGFGLYTLSDFIRRGEAIETENKLTI